MNKRSTELAGRRSPPGEFDILSAIRKVRQANKNFKVPAVTQVASDRDPFAVLISTLISLRTKDDVTATASARLLGRARTPAQVAKLPTATIEKLIYPAGFYRTKAQTIRDVSRVLLDEYDGNVPDEVDELVQLKGVGRKTANLVVTLGYRKPGICVDIHVHRISNRWGYVTTPNPDKTEWALREKLPRRHWIEFNDLLVTFGQNVCVPVSPKCSQCPLHGACPQLGVTRNR